MSGNSDRSYENFLSEKKYDYLCKGNFIEGNELLVNPDAKKSQILFTRSDVLAYCLGCEKKEKCDEDTRKKLLNALSDKWEDKEEQKI